jgi:Domain of unknown function (DUF4349)
MKLVHISFFALLVFCGLFACQKMESNANTEGAHAPKSLTESANISEEDKTLQALGTSAAAKVSRLDSLRKFIRTAEIKGEVQDVVNSTMAIETIAAQQGGFVISSKLDNNHYKDIKQISTDSALEITTTNLRSDMVIRVPFRPLDTTLRAIARQIKLFDHRYINAQDVTLDAIEQELLRVSNANLSTQMTNIGTQAGNTDTRIAAADRAAQAKNAEQAAWLKNQRIEDQVQFSTVSIAIYENSRIKTTMIINLEKTVQSPNFGYEISNAFRSGWRGLCNVFVTLLYLWPLYLVVGILYYLLKSRSVKFVKKG